MIYDIYYFVVRKERELMVLHVSIYYVCIFINVFDNIIIF